MNLLLVGRTRQITQDTASGMHESRGLAQFGEPEKSTCESKCFFQLSLPLRASEVAFGSEVHCVSEVSPFGEVANLTSLRP